MNQAKGYAGLITSSILWGVSYINTKICYQWFNAYSLTAYRYLLACTTLLAYVLIAKISLKMPRKDIFKLLALGFTGNLLCSLLGNIGLQYISPSFSSIIAGLLPVVTMLGQKLVYKIPMTRIKILSVALSVVGIICVVGFADSGSSSSFLMWIGILLSVGSVVAWTVANFLVVPFYSKYSVSSVAFYQNVGTMMIALTFIPFNPVHFKAIPMSGYLNMLFIGVVCTAVASIFYNFAIKEINLVACAVIVNLMPVVTIITDVIVLKERIDILQILGAVLIIVSAVMATGIERTKKAATGTASGS